MLHVHDSRLHMRELHCSDLLGEAAQVRLAAQANSEEPVRARPAALRARFAGATHALMRRMSSFCCTEIWASVASSAASSRFESDSPRATVRSSCSLVSCSTATTSG